LKGAARVLGRRHLTSVCSRNTGHARASRPHRPPRARDPHPCPCCGKPGNRKRLLCRRIRTLAYRQVAFLDVHYAEYHARCGCRKSFRSWPLDVPPRSRYCPLVRRAVLDRLLGDGLNVERTREAMKRDFLLELSAGFVYDCLGRELRRLDLPARRRRTLEGFAGTLCVDELHPGRHALLLATDPLADEVVGFALVGDNDLAHMRRFLLTLRWSSPTAPTSTRRR
jgi:hypothetical protein